MIINLFIKKKAKSNGKIRRGAIPVDQDNLFSGSDFVVVFQKEVSDAKC